MQDFESRHFLSKTKLNYVKFLKPFETIQPALANSIDNFSILNQFTV